MQSVLSPVITSKSPIMILFGDVEVCFKDFFERFYGLLVSGAYDQGFQVVIVFYF